MTTLGLVLTMSLAGVVSAFAGEDDVTQCDVVVVTPAGFDTALTPWIEHRRSLGHRPCLLRPTTADQTRERIVELARHGNLKHVVLVGDAPERLAAEAGRVGEYETPTFFLPATVNVHFGSEPWIATDSPYGDLDDDGVPELNVGRLAVDTPAELTVVVDKILEFEADGDFADWRRRIHVVAGVGGFGQLADSILESCTKRFIVDGIPVPYCASVTYGSWQSPYCPSPARFHEATIGRLNDGCLFWVYVGHGSPGSVAPLHTPRGAYRVLSNRDVGELAIREGSPIAVFLACYTAAFDLDVPGESLAEGMLRHPDGPVAILGASRVSMPYAMAVMSHELLREYFSGSHPTLGEMLTQAKRDTLSEDGPRDDNRELLDSLAGTFSPTKNLLEQERRENALLFNLIGDPLLRLRYPRPLEIDSPASVIAGQDVIVTGRSPIEGRLVVEIAYRRDRMLYPFVMRTDYLETPEFHDELDATYAKANDRVIASSETDARPGPFTLTLSVPEWARGAVYVRGFVQGPTDFALGGIETRVRPR